jgi:aspartate 4-decarboxylase
MGGTRSGARLRGLSPESVDHVANAGAGAHTSRADERLLESLSPFELKSRLLDLAGARGADLLLNAGRGNPNWIATVPRAAFFLLGRFGLAEAERVWSEPGIGGQPERAGIATRLAGFLDRHRDEPGADLLTASVHYGSERFGFDPDAWVHELTQGVLGDVYPSPDRMLAGAEQVVHDYLVKEMCGGDPPPGRFDLFAVEGGTAAICYLFETLSLNRLLRPGDRIALGVPVFTPYIEIPNLPRYHFDVVEVQASEVDDAGAHVWQYPDEELEKLADPAVKVFFLINPSNPPSVMIRQHTLDRIGEIIRDRNPDLIVLTDDVYGTFVPGFRSFMAAAPQNTIGVYSFSKYFGCTGWRLGVVAVHQDSVLDRLLAELPEDVKQVLDERYAPITLAPRELRFIDRMVADSRSVALNHTAGLSLPQQVQMTLFALAALLDTDDAYKRRMQEIVRHRLGLLSEGLGVPLPDDPNRAAYYAELDLMRWADRNYGAGFAAWMAANFEPVDVIFRLAEQESVVLLNGGGFGGPVWSVRVSLANLPDDAYRRIGAAIRRIGAEYVAEYEAATGNRV